MAPPKIQIDPESLARARALYETGTSLDVIGQLLGVSGQTVRNRAIELGWSRSRPARPVAEEWPDAPPPMREPTEEDAAPDAIVAGLGRLVARELLRTETYDHSPEVAARTLVMLSRSAAILHAIHARAPAQPEPDYVDAAAAQDAGDEALAGMIARLGDIYDQEGEQGLIDRIRFAPRLADLFHMVIRDRKRRDVEAVGETA